MSEITITLSYDHTETVQVVNGKTTISHSITMTIHNGFDIRQELVEDGWKYQGDRTWSKTVEGSTKYEAMDQVKHEMGLLSMILMGKHVPTLEDLKALIPKPSPPSSAIGRADYTALIKSSKPLFQKKVS